jgi:hypothetical protein
MYLSNTARYLGDSTAIAPVKHARSGPQHCADLWRAARCYHPQITFAEFQRKFPKCANALQCGDNRLPNGSVVAIDCPAPAPRALGHVYLGRLGTVPACQDPPTGLLIDCWNAAVAKGLNGVDQETLTRLSTAYQRLTRPGRLAGLGRWVPAKRGGMQWVNPQRLGADISDITSIDPSLLMAGSDWSGTITDAQGNQIPAPAWVVPSDLPPNPIGIITQPAPPPKIIENLQPTLPVVSAQTLLAAAALPNAPTVVKQAAAQLPQGAASSASSIFTGSAIAGIPNYLLMGLGLFFLVILASSGRRR